MKVLFLTNIPSPYRVSFFNELGKVCDLTVLYEKKYASHRDRDWLSKPSETFTEVFLEEKKIRKDTSICPSVTKYLNKSVYDIIVIGGYSTPTGLLAIQYCKMNKVPFILNADGGIIGKKNVLKDSFKRYFIGSAQAWLCTGLETRWYLEHYGAINHRTFDYPFTSVFSDDLIKTSQVDKKILKVKLKIEDRPTALSIGQFIHRKGFDVLLNSWVELDRDYNLIIIGGGEKKKELENQIERLGLQNVVIIDFLSPDVLSEYYKASDLFILPTREDVWGLVINEAMAHGLPVITTENCVAGKVLIKENGFLVPVEDFKALTEKTEYILQNAFLQDQMGDKSIEIMKDYTFENMANKHLEIFKTYLSIDSSEYLYE